MNPAPLGLLELRYARVACLLRSICSDNINLELREQFLSGARTTIYIVAAFCTPYTNPNPLFTTARIGGEANICVRSDRSCRRAWYRRTSQSHRINVQRRAPHSDTDTTIPRFVLRRVSDRSCSVSPLKTALCG